MPGTVLLTVLAAVAGTLFLVIDASRGVLVTRSDGGRPGLLLLVATLLGAPISTWALLGLGLIKPKR